MGFNKNSYFSQEIFVFSRLIHILHTKFDGKRIPDFDISPVSPHTAMILSLYHLFKEMWKNFELLCQEKLFLSHLHIVSSFRKIISFLEFLVFAHFQNFSVVLKEESFPCHSWHFLIFLFWFYGSYFWELPRYCILMKIRNTSFWYTFPTKTRSYSAKKLFTTS